MIFINKCFILQILCSKFDLFRYKQLIESLFNFISTYIYVKDDHFKKNTFIKGQ